MSEQIPLGPPQPPASSGTPPASSSPISRTQFDYFTKELFAKINQQFTANNASLAQDLARINDRFEAAEDRTTRNFTSINASIADVVVQANVRVNELEFQTRSDLYQSSKAVSQLTDQLDANVTALTLSQQESIDSVGNVQTELRRSQLDISRQLPTSVTAPIPVEIAMDFASDSTYPGLFTSTPVEPNIFDQSLNFLASTAPPDQRDHQLKNDVMTPVLLIDEIGPYSHDLPNNNAIVDTQGHEQQDGAADRDVSVTNFTGSFPQLVVNSFDLVSAPPAGMMPCANAITKVSAASLASVVLPVPDGHFSLVIIAHDAAYVSFLKAGLVA